MLTAKEILDLINHHLDHLPYTREPQSLYEPIRYVLSMVRCQFVKFNFQTFHIGRCIVCF